MDPLSLKHVGQCVATRKSTMQRFFSDMHSPSRPFIDRPVAARSPYPPPPPTQTLLCPGVCNAVLVLPWGRTGRLSPATLHTGMRLLLLVVGYRAPGCWWLQWLPCVRLQSVSMLN
ncbi:unnamed protein product [Arctogadus glacialis]